MGDAILSTVTLNTLRQNFPDAKIHFVLNEQIAPLFQEHPSIDRIITFSNDERHHTLTYLRKVWRIVHEVKYDIIIDMRSTTNTMLFALLSPTTPYRIGIKKPYTRWIFNCPVVRQRHESMITQNLALVKPLECLKPISYTQHFDLHVTTDELNAYRQYLEQCNIDFQRPIMLVGVTAKLASKVWPENYMVTVLQHILNTYPQMQLIFNYAPGQEEQNARRIHAALNNDPRILIDIKAKSARELYALASFVTLYFGNEGGARHIVHAAGKPSFVICAPSSNKKVWLPQNDVPARGIAISDIRTPEETAKLSYSQQYEAITPDRVWQELKQFINEL